MSLKGSYNRLPVPLSGLLGRAVTWDGERHARVARSLNHRLFG